AQVTSVEKNAAYVFAKISAKPAAGVENHRYVMILSAPPAAPPRPETRSDERKPAKERGKARRELPNR
ncbi:MAG: rod shape-determining protein MreC, partial [Bacillota bacterium]